ncbi:MAG: hypothetical protein OJF51_000825 [Nitrospira sp.]|nr:MAG: hypothetical protein OJF51_000825 [Nitrospira sp.]
MFSASTFATVRQILPVPKQVDEWRGFFMVSPSNLHDRAIGFSH